VFGHFSLLILVVNDSHPVTVWPDLQWVFGRAKPKTGRFGTESVRNNWGNLRVSAGFLSYTKKGGTGSYPRRRRRVPHRRWGGGVGNSL